MSVEENNFLTNDIIAKESLMVLKNNLTAAAAVNRSYQNTFGKVGDTISIRNPYRVKAADGRVLVKQPLVDQTIPLTINKQHNIGLEFTTNDRTLSIEQFSSRYIQPSVIQIANKVDATILMTLKTAYHSSGLAGTRAGSYRDFADSKAKMAKYGVPDDGLRRAILDPYTVANLSDETTKLFNEKMVRKSFINGYMGEVAGFSTYESANLPTHTTGNWEGGTPLMNGAGSNGKTVSIKGLPTSVTGVIKAGDVFRISNVDGINPQTYATTGQLRDFVVTEDVNSDGSGNAIVTISEAMNDGTATMTNDEGETISLSAYQNITALPIDNAPITFIGEANTIYEQNYLFHRDAIALACIPLAKPESAVVASRATDSESGLSILMTKAYDINEGAETARLDIIYGTKIIYAPLAMRLWGAAIGEVTP